jgi:hypothetical protein
MPAHAITIALAIIALIGVALFLLDRLDRW